MKKSATVFVALCLAMPYPSYADIKQPSKKEGFLERGVKLSSLAQMPKKTKPIMALNFSQTGIASWYGKAFAGKKTASGDVFNPRLMTAAHRYLPLNSVVKVTNLANNKSIRVVINDRGPYAKQYRIIDLSKQAASELGFTNQGITKVKVEYLHGETLDRSTKISKHKRHKLHTEIEKFSIKQLKAKINSY